MDSEESCEREIRTLKDRYNRLRGGTVGSLSPAEIDAELNRIDQRIQALEKEQDELRARRGPAAGDPAPDGPVDEEPEPVPPKPPKQVPAPPTPSSWPAVPRQPTEEPSEFQRLKKDIGMAVVITVIVGTFVTEGFLNGLAAVLQHASLEAGAEDYVEFLGLYLSTFALSATVTALLALWRIYGEKIHQMWYLGTFLVGASLTGYMGIGLAGLPAPSGGGLMGDTFRGLLAFFLYIGHYGVSTIGGAVAGIAGAFIIYRSVEYARSR